MMPTFDIDFGKYTSKNSEIKWQQLEQFFKQNGEKDRYLR